MNPLKINIFLCVPIFNNNVIRFTKFIYIALIYKALSIIL